MSTLNPFLDEGQEWERYTFPLKSAFDLANCCQIYFREEETMVTVEAQRMCVVKWIKIETEEADTWGNMTV